MCWVELQNVSICVERPAFDPELVACFEVQVDDCVRPYAVWLRETDKKTL